MSHGSERRRSERIAVGLAAEIEGGPLAGPVDILDVNLHGLFVAAPRLPELHERLTFAVVGAGVDLWVRGVVVRRLEFGRRVGFGVQLDPGQTAWEAWYRDLSGGAA